MLKDSSWVSPTGTSEYSWGLYITPTKLQGPSSVPEGLCMARTTSNSTHRTSKPLQTLLPCPTHWSSWTTEVSFLPYSETCSSSISVSLMEKTINGNHPRKQVDVHRIFVYKKPLLNQLVERRFLTFLLLLALLPSAPWLWHLWGTLISLSEAGAQLHFTVSLAAAVSRNNSS